jgi:Protein of unknown function (DUF2971)
MSEKIELDLLKVLSPRRKPQILFHYTSAEGLIGILKARAIWATSIRFLNDSTEYRLAISLARQFIEEHSKKVRGKFDTALYAVLSERLTLEVEEVYVSSFTENPDQLSQWRAYCPATGGYAIGFWSKSLMDVPDPPTHRFLARCVYESHLHQELVRTLVKDVVSIAEESLSDGMSQDRVFREAYKRLGRLLPLLAPALKDPSFAEEQEWRLVCLSASFENDTPQFRQGRSMLVPYYMHRFPKNVTVPIEDLVIGPTPHPRLALDATRSLLSAYELSSSNVRSSVIPYRNW